MTKQLDGSTAPDGSKYVSIVDGEGNLAIGTPADEAWNGTDPEATVISLLKAIADNTSA